MDQSCQDQMHLQIDLYQPLLAYFCQNVLKSQYNRSATMKLVVEVLTNHQQLLEQLLDGLEKLLYKSPHPDSQTLDKINALIMDIQHHPKLCQRLLSNNRICQIVGSFPTSRHLWNAFQKDIENLTELNEHAQESISIIRSRAIPAEKKRLIQTLHEMINAYRGQLRVEAELILPMILLLFSENRAQREILPLHATLH